MKTYLVTRNSESWSEGVDHVVTGGLWLRVYKKEGRLNGDLMCLELPFLKRFGALYELDHLHLDREIRKKGDYLSIHLYRVWGNKLRDIESFMSNE